MINFFKSFFQMLITGITASILTWSMIVYLDPNEVVKYAIDLGFDVHLPDKIASKAPSIDKQIESVLTSDSHKLFHHGKAILEPQDNPAVVPTDSIERTTALQLLNSLEKGHRNHE